MLPQTLRNALALFAVAAAGLAQAGEIGPSLKTKLAAAQPDDRLEVIVTFTGRGPARASQLALLQQAGIARGITFRVLPMAGVLATPGQVRQLAALPAVRSVWHNDPLQFANEGSRKVSSVDAMRTDPALIARNGGLPYTGKGVGVFVLDSGVDATHADLAYGTHVVQNVIGHASLAGLANEFTGNAFTLYPYVENVRHSDVLGSHGTHVTGIVGGSGAMSDGKYAGVAPGANLIGYGTGATIVVLNSLGGMDWALANREEYNIRVLNGSYGCADPCTDQPLSPDDPSVVATKMLADQGVTSVFAAGNSGPGENSINDGFKKAPWVVIAAAGTKAGRLANFSSRGKKNYEAQTFQIDGQTFQTENRPTIVGPGVDVISARAKSADVVTPVYGGLIISDALNLADGVVAPEHAPFYTQGSGTSQASPHIAGVVALMLEANPKLQWQNVKAILQRTATGMPGLEDWEEGAGYVNARAAVSQAAKLRRDYGAPSKLTRRFNASVIDATGSASSSETLNFVQHYDAVDGVSPSQPFEVAAGLSRVVASATGTAVEGFVKAELQDPSGNWHSASLVDFATASDQNYLPVEVPAVPGTWRVRVTGALIGGPEGGPGLTTSNDNEVPVTVRLITDAQTSETRSVSSVVFTPYGPPVEVPFDVAADISLVSADVDTFASTVGLQLIDPEGVRYASAIAIGPTALRVTAPAKAGRWLARIRGIGSISGQAVSPPPGPVPFNGWGTPEPMDLGVTLTRSAVQTIGLDDIVGHPARGFIETGVRKRLFDGLPDGTFRPNAALRRIDLANYLTLSAAVRQSLPLNGVHTYTDVLAPERVFAESMAVTGGSLKDAAHDQRAIIAPSGPLFDRTAGVSRLQFAYSLVQALGLEAQALAMAGQPVTAMIDGQPRPVADLAGVAPELFGYVQLAINHGFVTPVAGSVRQPDGTMLAVARFQPVRLLKRAEFAAAAVRADTVYGARE